MWAPTKPWEIPSNNFRSPPVTASPYSYRSIPGIRKVERKTMEDNSEKLPPAPPPRPQRQTTTSNYGYGGYNMYGGYQSPYYGGYSGGYGGYGGYGSYNNMYGGYGANRYGLGYGDNQPTSSFVEQAERNSRVAFDSIHSIVQAFGSIAMMFESTFFAVHSSFRAVLGVADHFSRLRHNLVQAVGSNFAVKWLRNILRKIMILVGLRSPTSVEEVWSEVRSAAMGQSGQSERHVWRSWPLLLFFAVVLGTPWLIWKFLSSLGDEEHHRDWMTGEGDHVLGEALFDFVGEGEDELSFCAGDSLKIAPKERQPRIRGWLLATVDETTKGIVPANYVKILGFKHGSKIPNGGTLPGPSNSTSFVEDDCNDGLEDTTHGRKVVLDQAFEETTTDFGGPVDTSDNGCNDENKVP